MDIGAAGADHHLKLARFADIFDVAVVELEQFGIDGERHHAALAFLEGDTTEALQFLDGTGDTAHEVADVELNVFGARTTTRVRKGYLCLDCAAARQFVAA